MHGTAAHLAARARLEVLGLRDRHHERRFDKTHGVSTRGVVNHSGAPEGAHGYQPVRATAFARALDATGVDPRGLTFVDLGCGKGAALVLAANYGFSRVVGVEFDPVIADACAANLKRSPTVVRSGARSEVVCTDATTYELPTEQVVLFLYNPFSGDLLQRVVDNLEQSLATAPRDVWVVYLNPLERRRFDDSPALVVVASRTEADAARARPGDLYVVYRAASPRV